MRSKIGRVLAALVLACMLIVPFGAAFGDAGSFAGSSSYSSGSSSSGGSSYSGGSSGGSYYYGSSYDDDGDGGLDFGTIAIIVIIVALIVIGSINRGGKGGSGGKRGNDNPVHIDDNFDASKMQGLSSLKEKDPTFDSDDITEDISNWYVQMQNAWTAGDFSPMEPHFSDALYAQFSRQLNQLNRAGQVNHVDNIAVLSVALQGWYQEDGQDFLVAKVQTRIVDYTVEKATGNLVSGDKTRELFMTYRWILSRSSDATTGQGAQMQNCPNCGAAVDVNKSAKCPYCDSILQSESHGWVISAIQGLEQRS